MAGDLLAVTLADGSKAWVPLSGASVALPPPPPPPPPPPGGATIFGYQTSDATRNTKVGWWTRVPCGRGYYGVWDAATNPLSTNGFAPGGKEYKLACLDLPNAVSAKRINLSTKFDPSTVTSSSSPYVQALIAHAKTVPGGWRVYYCHHEYNRGITASKAGQFVNAFKIIAAALYTQNLANLAAGKGEVIYVINAAGSGIASGAFDPSWAPAASTMPPNTQFWSDAYDNPVGSGGYKNYGTKYNDIGTKVLNDVYDMALTLGYLDNSDGGTRGWGIGEFNSPRRVAPKLATLDSDNGWGPLSPADLSGAGQAQAITDYCTWCLGQTDPTRTVPAKVVLLWMQPGGTNWNQDFSTAGVPKYDDWSDTPSGTVGTVKGPHWQGWTINVDPSKPRDAYKAFVNISA